MGQPRDRWRDQPGISQHSPLADDSLRKRKERIQTPSTPKNPLPGAIPVPTIVLLKDFRPQHQGNHFLNDLRSISARNPSLSKLKARLCLNNCPLKVHLHHFCTSSPVSHARCAVSAVGSLAHHHTRRQWRSELACQTSLRSAPTRGLT